jgi:putative PIN family toxin of toxin-antitoxin system
MIRLVLDTNVLVSANLNDEGFEALVVALALNRKIQLYVSEAILDEYQRVLLYPRLKFVPKEIIRFLARLRRVSAVVALTRTLSISSDEPDNRFLECAEAAGADFLVTGNKRHFPKQWKTTQVVNARELLGLIGSSFLK